MVPPQSAVFRRQQDESVQHRHILLSTDYWNLQSTDTDSNHKTKVTALTAGPGIDLYIPVIPDEGSEVSLHQGGEIQHKAIPKLSCPQLLCRQLPLLSTDVTDVTDGGVQMAPLRWSLQVMRDRMI